MGLLHKIVGETELWRQRNRDHWARASHFVEDEKLARGPLALRFLASIARVALLFVRTVHDWGLVIATIASAGAGISGLAGGLSSAKWLIQLSGGMLGAALWVRWSMGSAIRSGRLARPPGARLEQLVDFVCSRKTRDRVFLPIITDFRSEHFDALADGRVWKARWVRVRGYLGFWRAVGLHGAVKLALDVLRAVKGAS